MATKRKPAHTHLPRGGPRPNSGRPSLFRGKTANLMTRVRPVSIAKLRAIAAQQSISLSDALELVIERADPAVTV